MDFQKWAKNSLENVQEDHMGGVKQSLWPVYRKIIEQVRRVQPAGDNIYDYDWDLLIVVDACRLDLMQEVATDYDYIPEVNTVWSVDSTTALWMQRTFKKRDTSDTTYICSNPFSADYLAKDDFNDLREVWKKAWNTPGTVPPRAITDATIDSMRNKESSRTIAHYLQPHCPFIPKPDLSEGKRKSEFGDQDHRDVWELYRDSVISFDELWEGYRQNLKLVLDDISLLLENVSAEKVVITSDHGNALGRWGIYGHPPRMPHKSLREVPWIETSAKENGDYSPEMTDYEQSQEVDRDDQLAALGYM
ncbi:hypothetical protein EGO51_09080 [Haloarcula hispanica]|uniref:Uncharacterized protein n=1 Tax=Haloarcula hispanica TaxID=51589 RepID=A0A5J5LKG3_HALHI|nr:LTA synthase family protein [Haloarcula hispanica]KAA9409949.1 hypothetical protein EGO51_09080 [Haloarcula hispanica]